MKELSKEELMEVEGGFIFDTNGHWWMYALGVLAIAAIILL